MRRALLLAAVLLVAGSVLAEEHHDDRIDAALDDLERAQASASSTWTTLSLGALWGLAAGSLLGVGAGLMATGGDHR